MAYQHPIEQGTDKRFQTISEGLEDNRLSTDQQNKAKDKVEKAKSHQKKFKSQLDSDIKVRVQRKPNKFNSRQAVVHDANSPFRRDINYLTPPKPDEMESDNENRSGASTKPRQTENKLNHFARQSKNSSIEVSRHAKLRASKGQRTSSIEKHKKNYARHPNMHGTLDLNKR